MNTLISCGTKHNASTSSFEGVCVCKERERERNNRRIVWPKMMKYEGRKESLFLSLSIQTDFSLHGFKYFFLLSFQIFLRHKISRINNKTVNSSTCNMKCFFFFLNLFFLYHLCNDHQLIWRLWAHLMWFTGTKQNHWQ